MKGHIRERSPGHWAIVLDVRDPAPARGGANGTPSPARSGKHKRVRPTYIGNAARDVS